MIKEETLYYQIRCCYKTTKNQQHIYIQLQSKLHDIKLNYPALIVRLQIIFAEQKTKHKTVVAHTCLVFPNFLVSQFALYLLDLKIETAKAMSIIYEI